jgi:tetratricopeptide (TPR) repeat protein
MINLQIKFSFIITTILLLSLAACSQLGMKKEIKEEPKQDLFELQKQADAAYSNDDMDTSERDYKILIRELPEIALHWFRLGNIYVRTNRPDAAIDLYREAVLRDPTFANAWFNMSIVQLKQTAYSLQEMLIYTNENDPMYTKAKNLLDGILAIIKQD